MGHNPDMCVVSTACEDRDKSGIRGSSLQGSHETPSPFPTLKHTCTHTHTHARARARARAHHPSIYLYLCVSMCIYVCLCVSTSDTVSEQSLWALSTLTYPHFTTPILYSHRDDRMRMVDALRRQDPAHVVAAKAAFAISPLSTPLWV